MRRSLLLLLFVFSLPLFADPTVSTITPRSGLIAGGTIVHIHGTNLFFNPPLCGVLGCPLTIQFGNALGDIIFDSADEIVVVAPPHAAGPVDLVVTFPPFPVNLAPLTLKNAFTYEDPDDTTVRLLLPVAAGTQGILNTSWQTDILAHNETPSPVVIAGTTIPPLATQKLSLSPASTGMFLQIPRSVFEGVTITTHVHDTTHDAESLGVDVPSVPETQFRRTVVLTGVPNDARYRVLLRAYGYPGVYAFLVNVRDDSTGELLSTQTSPVLVSSDLQYLQMPISAPQTAHTLRVAVTGGAPIWAFLTLTNNTTESVTTITPNIGVAPEASSNALAVGRWAHAGYCATVDQSNDVTVMTGCGFGMFQMTDVVAADGHFEADGHFAISVGPVQQPPVPQPPAHFSGIVRNGTLAMTIRTATQTIGPFTLIYGSTEPCAPPCL